MVNIAVFISGTGSNLKAIHAAIQSGGITNARLACVISNKQTAPGLGWAAQNGIETHFVNPKDFASREAYDTALLKLMQEKEIGLICLAGYMRVVSSVLVDAFYGRILNIHPSLLPSFPGLDAQKQALDYGVKYSGCTVHFVDGGMDTGPIILQSTVPVMDNDTLESLSARILAAEHKTYPHAVNLYTNGQLQLSGRIVKINSPA